MKLKPYQVCNCKRCREYHKKALTKQGKVASLDKEALL